MIRLPPEPKGQRKYVGRNLVVACVVITNFGVNLGSARANTEGEPSADVAAKCIRTSAAGNKIHGANRATIPPGPVWVASDGCARSGRFTRAMVPTTAANCVRAQL